MTSSAPSKPGIRKRAVHEIVEFAVIAGYLYVAFGALTLFKIAILRSEGIDWAPWGFAVIKAALIAKFILVGRAVHVGERFKGSPLIWQTAYRSVVFLAVVLVLNVIEEVLVGLIHDRGAWQSVAGMGGGTSLQLAATVFLIFLIFLPYFAFRALGEVLGEQTLFKLFFVERRKLETAGQ